MLTHDAWAFLFMIKNSKEIGISYLELKCTKIASLVVCPWQAWYSASPESKQNAQGSCPRDRPQKHWFQSVCSNGNKCSPHQFSPLFFFAYGDPLLPVWHSNCGYKHISSNFVKEMTDVDRLVKTWIISNNRILIITFLIWA